ncbi:MULTISPECIES: LysR family transcriptional regulator [Thalassospira]|uniref:LysR family transcriptional regulator n=2 Tax=Thalassospira TaxID=168934 RepID=A0A367W5Q7_9PROT|nr:MULTISPECIES: LysR family transcriptional regulator [Thalassospira]MDG4721128.1 LysR family transcriptional regulator [Thalassospira sp. FZY0004]RCK36778.1 LysR family transcriptional regulator [Thalassospira profundimaris]
MDLLTNLSLFIRIVEKGGLAAAGRDFGLSPATVSERVNALEDHFGARLLNRTTRAISLTDEGRTLLDGGRRLVGEASDLRSQIRHGVDHLSGLIRVSVTFDLGRNIISPLLDQFIEQHPDISIDLILSDGYVDLVGQGIDIAVRYGNLTDSSLIRKKLAPVHRRACASPEYLAKHGTPTTPSDLAKHNCLVMRFGNQPEQEWPFTIDGKRKLILVKGNRTANDGSLIRQWAVAGYGICLKANWDVRNDIDTGRLVPILGSFTPPSNDLQLVYPAGRAVSKRVRYLIDYLLPHFSRTSPT